MNSPIKTPVAKVLIIVFLFCFPITKSIVQSSFAAERSEHQASQQIGNKPKLDVGYQPTPYKVVKEMLKVADVRREDLVYDLGCGDGRIVIMAAKDRGAQGVGIDLDQERINESIENAKKAGVTDKVKFIAQDLFKTDIRKATVVMLYLWPDVNLRLRPRLFSELQPGTRVLSHNHDMGEWKPDKYVEILKHRIYFWVIPANIAGSWKWSMKVGSGTTDAALQLNQSFQKITGTLTIGNSKVPFTPANLIGDQLRLSAVPLIDGKKVTVKLFAQAKGNKLNGTMEIPGRASSGLITWNAERSK